MIVRPVSGNAGHVLWLTLVHRTTAMLGRRLDRMRVEGRVMRGRRRRDIRQVRRSGISVGSVGMLNRSRASVPGSSRSTITERADPVAIGILWTVVTGQIDNRFILPPVGFLVVATVLASQQEQDDAEQDERDGASDCTSCDKTRARPATSVRATEGQ